MSCEHTERSSCGGLLDLRGQGKVGRVPAAARDFLFYHCFGLDRQLSPQQQTHSLSRLVPAPPRASLWVLFPSPPSRPTGNASPGQGSE